MRDYVIYTDSSSDISQKILSEWGVSCLSLTFRFSDSEREFSNSDMEIGEFYNKMRAGGVAKTAAVNSETFRESFEAILKEGRDVLYIGFSSGLSTTYNSARIAAESLKEDYPDGKVLTVDSLAASAGLGMLVRLAVLKKAEGKSIDEVRDYIESIKLKMCHWFTVDDLNHLKRGGRISKSTTSNRPPPKSAEGIRHLRNSGIVRRKILPASINNSRRPSWTINDHTGP